MKIAIFGALAGAGGVLAQYSSLPKYPTPYAGTVPEWQTAYLKASSLVAQLTLVEKVNLTSGTGSGMGPCVGNTGAVPRFGIGSLCLHDGPLGVRATDYNTAFPAGISVGATWNSTAMLLRGKAIGDEFRGKGINIGLGGMVGPLGRKPAGGRNWEGFGADPYLQGVGAVQSIVGQQSAGVIATAKHFIGNEQEALREELLYPGYSSNIDDRTLHELYLWPFAESIHAGVGAVMASYNQVNNSYVSQNSYLLNQILKNELGFQGFVLSDWYGQRAGVDAIIAGLDMSMPGEQSVITVKGCGTGTSAPCGPGFGKPWWASELSRSVLNGSVPQSRLDDAAIRILTPYFMLGQDKGYPPPNFSANTENDTGKPFPGSLLANIQQPTIVVNQHVRVNTTEHAKLARDIATEAITLLKNDNCTLPMGTDTKLSIFGTDAFPNPNGPNSCPLKLCNIGVLGMGWGSGSANYPFLTDPASRIKARAPNTTFYNSDTFPSGQIDTSGTALVFISSDSGEFTNPVGFIMGQPTQVEGSTGDRITLYAAHNGDALVQAVASRFSRVIVIAHSVGPIIMENWVDHPNVTAVIMAHLPGQEAGDSLADVLFGVVSPSGHLPYSIVRSPDTYNVSTNVYNPGFLASGTYEDNFSERLYIDYRFLQKYNVAPRFAFGHGLSYTTFCIMNATISSGIQLSTAPPAPAARPIAQSFTIENLATAAQGVNIGFFASLANFAGFLYPTFRGATSVKVGRYNYPPTYPAGVEVPPQPAFVPAAGGLGGNPALWDIVFVVTAEVMNTGNVAAQMVTQLYVQFPANITYDTPPRQLRGFQKVQLAPGQSALQRFEIRRKDISVWDVVTQNWVIPDAAGSGYTVWLGQSSDKLEMSCNTVSLLCQ